jgi:hypothetical protein
MCIFCELNRIVVPLPPDKHPFAVNLNNNNNNDSILDKSTFYKFRYNTEVECLVLSLNVMS